MDFRHYLVLALSLLLLNSSHAFARPDTWAKPIATRHLNNFYQISPMLYRSAQPYLAGFDALNQYGIGEVLDLRLYHHDKPSTASLTLHQVPLLASNLTPQRVIQALQVIAHAQQPVLVHCLHGSDRTGLVIALYRVVCQNWSKQQALDELTHGDYGYHAFFTNIPEFIQSADIENLRQQIHGANCPSSR